MFTINSETARRTAAKFCMQTCVVSITDGLGLKSIGVVHGHLDAIYLDVHGLSVGKNVLYKTLFRPSYTVT